jgi:glutathione synthase/RimK-type ligase-like ATP-grasp enzyme
MILIITHKEDFTADFVIEKLNKRNIKYFRLNCEDIHTDIYNFENENDFHFNINGISNFTSVWFRRTKLPEIISNNEAEKLYLLSDYETLFDNIYNLIDTEKWLSNPHYIFKAENKLLQLKIAKSIGFIIPQTLITNSHKKLKSFIDKFQNNIIIKPIRQGRIRQKEGFETIFTNKLSLDNIKTINEFDLTPCIFQEYVDKEYEIRVTVIGEKVFSAKINSQISNETKIDWRKEKMPFEKYELPKDISEKCILITKKLQLSFGAIDLIKKLNGEYVFLEINPNGQWAWLETELDLKISDEIINYLTLK